MYLLRDRFAYSLSWSPFLRDYAKTRFEKSTSAFFRTNTGYSVFNPLVLYNAPEIFETTNEYKTEFLKTPCNYSSFRPKRVFSEAYQKMGLVFDCDKVVGSANV